MVFLFVQLLIGLLILIQFNKLTIIFGCLALIPVFIYPLMKRITWWPQVFLGITFKYINYLKDSLSYVSLKSTLASSKVFRQIKLSGS